MINPRVSALYVMVVATLAVGVYAAAIRQINFGVLRKHLGFFLLIGLLIAGSTNLSYIAVSYVDPGAATLLTQLSTPLSILIGVVWLKERFTRWQFVGAALATAGVCIVALQPSDFFRVGSLLIMCAVPLYAFHTALVKRNGDLDFANFYFFRLLFTTLALFLFSAVQGALEWPAPMAWPLLFATGAIDVAGSRALYYLALRRLKLGAHALILTISPVITTLWSFGLFGIVPTAQQIVGGVVVMLGVWLATIGWRYFGSKALNGFRTL
jgi:drug/metabolite transporter (DMT)-like permease